MISRHGATATQQVAAVRAHRTGGTKAVQTVSRRTGGALKGVFSSLSLSVSPSYVEGSSYGAGQLTVTTDQATATASGGLGTISYAWASNSAGWSAVNPSSATTSFRKQAVGPGQQAQTSFTCTATDQGGASAFATCTATAYNIYSGPEN